MLQAGAIYQSACTNVSLGSFELGSVRSYTIKERRARLLLLRLDACHLQGSCLSTEPGFGVVLKKLAVAKKTKCNRASVMSCCLLYSIKNKGTRVRCLVLLSCLSKALVAGGHLSAWLSGYVVPAELDKTSGGRDRRQAAKQPVNEPNNQPNKTIKRCKSQSCGVFFVFVVYQSAN